MCIRRGVCYVLTSQARLPILVSRAPATIMSSSTLPMPQRRQRGWGPQRDGLHELSTLESTHARTGLFEGPRVRRDRQTALADWDAGHGGGGRDGHGWGQEVPVPTSGEGLHSEVARDNGHDTSGTYRGEGRSTLAEDMDLTTAVTAWVGGCWWTRRRRPRC